MKNPETAIERLAGDIADDATLDHQRLAQDVADATLRAGLIDVAWLAQGFRRAQLAVPGSVRPFAATRFRFGGLEARECIGSGAQGEVWRAYDPLLDQEVALKLRRLESGELAHRFLEEGRRLARLRHPNIVNVYGAAVHEGRTGLWTELVRGQSLARIIEEGGPLPAEDVRSIGLDLSAALAAVHRHGLVHGDVKASNVMRDAGGRIVLMDFGTAREIDAEAGLVLSGTRPYLAPELLAGAAPSPASDLYALGVLLHRLLSGRYPEDGGRPALPAGVPGSLARAVANLLAADPQQRPASAAATMQLLTRIPAGIHRSYAVPAVAAVGVVAAALIGAWVLRSVPAWQTEVALERAAGSAALEPIASGTPVRLGDQLQLRLRSSEPVWLYVLDDDGGGAADVLFPLEGTHPGNPLAADTDYELPAAGTRPLTWRISSAAVGEELLVLVSRRPQTELERLLQDWRHAHRIAAGTQRGALAVVPAPGTETLTSARLRDALAVAERSTPGDLRRWRFVLPHAK